MVGIQISSSLMSMTSGHMKGSIRGLCGTNVFVFLGVFSETISTSKYNPKARELGRHGI